MNLLTVHEVAKYLKCSERFVADELRRKKMRGSKVGAGWRISEVDLEVYVQSHANVRPVKKAAS